MSDYLTNFEELFEFQSGKYTLKVATQNNTSKEICTLLLGSPEYWQWRMQGFPEGAHQSQGGHQPIIWSVFSRKLDEKKEVLMERGRVPSAPSPLDPPLIGMSVAKTCSIKIVAMTVIRY